MSQQVIEALAVFEELRQYASCEEIKVRLGGDADGLPMHQNK